MSIHPIDIVANAILAADSGHPEPRALAGVAVDALTDERIVAHAADALDDNAPLWFRNACRNNVDYEHIARIVLRSVGGA